jgi:hypothetical protein
MRRSCITLVLVGSLLVAATPAAQATSIAGHRQEARAGAAQTHRVTTHRVNRARNANRVHKFTYGRT